MSFIYEVNLEIDTKIAKDFGQWLEPHIEEMLSFDGFQSAQWLVRNKEDEGIERDVVLWTVQYVLEGKDSYLRYLSTHAPRMRQEGMSKFGDAFRATRRLLYIHSSFQTQS